MLKSKKVSNVGTGHPVLNLNSVILTEHNILGLFCRENADIDKDHS